MYEYEVRNSKTGEEITIFGYWYEDACKRSKLNPDEWGVTRQTYID